MFAGSGGISDDFLVFLYIIISIVVIIVDIAVFINVVGHTNPAGHLKAIHAPRHAISSLQIHSVGRLFFASHTPQFRYFHQSVGKRHARARALKSLAA